MAAEKKYIVASLAGSLPAHIDCRIYADGELFPAIYAKVFGPATKAECETWIANNCNK